MTVFVDPGSVSGGAAAALTANLNGVNLQGWTNLNNAYKRSYESSPDELFYYASEEISNVDWHRVLDIVGYASLIPTPVTIIIGAAANGANAAWYAAEGDYVNATLSGVAAIPMAKVGTTALKAGFKGFEIITKASPELKLAGETTDDVLKAVKEVNSVTEGTSKTVPNPYGKLGGPAHQEAIQNAADTLKKGGYDVTFEERVMTPGGYKPVRYGDILAKDPESGEQWIIQVGKQTKAGNPISRETKAIQDLMNAGYKAAFVPYN